MSVDVLAVGAHPDDVDLIAGGTVAKLAARGRSVIVLDLTRGETGTRGTPQTRQAEARESAKVLGVSERISLDLGDSVLQNSPDNRRTLVEIIRKLRPTLILTHHWEDLHPDHCRTGEMMRDIMYPVGLQNLKAQGEAYRPNEVLFFMGHFPFIPSFVVDVSEHFETKVRAVQCFASQLADAAVKDQVTGIAQPDFLLKLEARARFYGGQIQKTFGEPFFVRRPVPVEDPVDLYRPFPKL